MKRQYWIAATVVALVVGVLVGYGVWGTGASHAAELQSKVVELAQENADLKSKLEALAGPAPEVPGARASVPAAPTEEKK